MFVTSRSTPNFFLATLRPLPLSRFTDCKQPQRERIVLLSVRARARNTQHFFLSFSLLFPCFQRFNVNSCSKSCKSLHVISRWIYSNYHPEIILPACCRISVCPWPSCWVRDASHTFRQDIFRVDRWQSSENARGVCTIHATFGNRQTLKTVWNAVCTIPSYPRFLQEIGSGLSPW